MVALGCRLIEEETSDVERHLNSTMYGSIHGTGGPPPVGVGIPFPGQGSHRRKLFAVKK